MHTSLYDQDQNKAISNLLTFQYLPYIFPILKYLNNVDVLSNLSFISKMMEKKINNGFISNIINTAELHISCVFANYTQRKSQTTQEK